LADLGLIADFAGGFIAPACLIALLALALNLQWGHAGLFNAGIAGFFGVGAYAGAIVMTPNSPAGSGVPGHLGFAGPFPLVGGFPTSLLVGLIAAMIASGLIAFLIAIPTLRLRADYLAIATVALGAIIVEAIRLSTTLTGGVYGITGIPRPWEAAAETWRTEGAFAAFVAALLVVTYLILNRATRSPWGRVLKAIREDEDAALALGKNTYFLKLQAFVLGAALMGGAGALYGSYLRLVVPDIFIPAFTFSIWVVVIVGGSGNTLGVVLGAFALTFLQYFTLRAKDWFHLPEFWAEKIFFIRLIVIGVLLIALVILRPQGLLPEPLKVSRRPKVVLGRA
jgi:branched-chain amino acid transport system permease protein